MTITVHLPTSRATYYHPNGTIAFTRRLSLYNPLTHTFTNEDQHPIHLGHPIRQDADTITYRNTSPARWR